MLCNETQDAGAVPTSGLLPAGKILPLQLN